MENAKMWKELMVKFGKLLLIWGANLLWNFADTDKNGELSQKELKSLFNKIQKILKK